MRRRPLCALLLMHTRLPVRAAVHVAEHLRVVRVRDYLETKSMGAGQVGNGSPCLVQRWDEPGVPPVATDAGAPSWHVQHHSLPPPATRLLEQRARRQRHARRGGDVAQEARRLRDCLSQGEGRVVRR